MQIGAQPELNVHSGPLGFPQTLIDCSLNDQDLIRFDRVPKQKGLPITFGLLVQTYTRRTD